jgi:hypothetical protein
MTYQLAIRYSLLLLAVTFLSACEKAPELEVQDPGFSFKDDNSTLRATDGVIRIDFAGAVNDEALLIELNEQSIESVGTTTPYRYSVNVDQVRRSLNNGLNTILVEDTITGMSEVFTFFLDVVEPRLVIDGVSFDNVNLPLAGQGVSIRGRISDLSDVKALEVTCVHPNGAQSKASALISGDSPMQRFELNIPCDYPDRKDPIFESDSDADYDSNVHWITTNPDYSFVVTDIEDNQYAINLAVPESRYISAVDVQINESLFNNLEPYLSAASAYAISQSKSIDLFKIACLEGTDGTNCDAQASRPNVGDVVVISPDYPDLATNTFIPNTMPSDIYSYASDLDIHGFQPRGGSPLCPVEVLEGKPGIQIFCALYIRQVNIDTPKFDFQFLKSNGQPRLDGLAKFGDLNVDIELVTISNLNYETYTSGDVTVYANGGIQINGGSINNFGTKTASHVEFRNSSGEIVRFERKFTATYEGSLSGRIGFDDSTLKIGMEILAGQASQSRNSASDKPGELFRFNRIKPIEIEQPFNYGHPLILNPRCSSGTCTINRTAIDALAWIYGLKLTGTGRDIGSLIMSTLVEGLDAQIGSVVDAGLDAVSTVVPSAIIFNDDPNTDGQATREEMEEFDADAPMRGVETDLFASKVEAGYLYNQEWLSVLPGLGEIVTYAARFNFDGNVRAKYDNSCFNPGDENESLTRPSEVVDGKASGGSHENYPAIN